MEYLKTLYITFRNAATPPRGGGFQPPSLPFSIRGIVIKGLSRCHEDGLIFYALSLMASDKVGH
jgi:hypothetical protein